MLLAKLINRVRRYFARAIDARPTLPTRISHRAYPETHIDDDGNWVVHFYSYEPIGWLYHGEPTPVPPAVPEPKLPHPNTYAEGQAPADSQIAWRQYYAERPQAITHLEDLTGKAANRAAAHQAAYRALRARLAHYRRES